MITYQIHCDEFNLKKIKKMAKINTFRKLFFNSIIEKINNQNLGSSFIGKSGINNKYKLIFKKNIKSYSLKFNILND